MRRWILLFSLIIFLIFSVKVSLAIEVKGIEWYCGMNCNTKTYRYSSNEATESLNDLSSHISHSNYVLINVWVEAENDNITVNPRYDLENEYIAAILKAKSKGYKVAFRIMHYPSPYSFKPANTDLWIKSYTQAVVYWAQFAQTHNVELFGVINELNKWSDDSYSSYWNSLINQIDSVYGGGIFSNINFWDTLELFNEKCSASWLGNEHLDYIAVSSYWKMCNYPGATIDQLVQNWHSYIAGTNMEGKDMIEQLRTLGETHEKQIIIVTGLASARNVETPKIACEAPWSYDWESYDSETIEIQRRWYVSVFRVFNDKPWVYGYFFDGAWQTNPNKRSSPNNYEFTVQGKPAEIEIENGFSISPSTCSDGTAISTCSAVNKPKWCDASGNLIDNQCNAPHNCPCPTSKPVCNADGSCSSKELVGYWRFDESGGSTVLDNSGKDNTGYLMPSSDGPIWHGPRVGDHSLKFDGINDYVRINDDSTLDVINGVTISAWVYPLNWPSTYPRIVSKEKETSVDAAPYNFELNTSGRSLTLCLDTGSVSCINSGTDTISLRQWQLVTGTWDGSNVKIYINGQLKKTASLSGIMTNTANNVLIGNNPSNNRQFNGSIDEVKIWNYALTQDEITIEYNSAGLESRAPVISISSPKVYTSLTQGYYWKMNVSIDFAIDEDVNWIGYSLDGKPNVTIDGPIKLSNYTIDYPYRITAGTHEIKIYATDTAGNTGFASIANFLYCPADVNASNGKHDGKVDIKDLAVVSNIFGSYPGHSKWNANYDLNNDNVIDIKDQAFVSAKFGLNCWGGIIPAPRYILPYVLGIEPVAIVAFIVLIVIEIIVLAMITIKLKKYNKKSRKR